MMSDKECKLPEERDNREAIKQEEEACDIADENQDSLGPENAETTADIVPTTVLDEVRQDLAETFDLSMNTVKYLVSITSLAFEGIDAMMSDKKGPKKKKKKKKTRNMKQKELKKKNNKIITHKNSKMAPLSPANPPQVHHCVQPAISKFSSAASRKTQSTTRTIGLKKRGKDKRTE